MIEVLETDLFYLTTRKYVILSTAQSKNNDVLRKKSNPLVDLFCYCVAKILFGLPLVMSNHNARAGHERVMWQDHDLNLGQDSSKDKHRQVLSLYDRVKPPCCYRNSFHTFSNDQLSSPNSLIKAF